MSRIQVRRDSSANWTSVNPTLAVGEIGYETDTGKFKIGLDGYSWSALDYFETGGGGGGSITVDAVLTDGSGNPIANNAVYDAVAALVSADSALDTRVDALEAGGGTSLPEFIYAVFAESANQAHVNHGPFLLPNTDYTKATVEFWIEPHGGQYFNSPGEGGAHAPVLIGVDTVSDGGHSVSGNSWDANTGTAISFNTTEKIRTGEPACVAWSLTGTYLVVHFNGIPVYVRPYTGKMRISALYESVNYVFGSDHQGFDGYIYGFRIFMGVNPYSPAIQNDPYRPELAKLTQPVWNGVEMVAPTLACPYFQGTLEDFGVGLDNGSGVLAKHPGYFAEASDGFGDDYNRIPAKHPVFVSRPFAWPTTSAAQKTQIPGSRIYADFSQPDVHKGNSAVLGVQPTRIGAKAWSSVNYCVINGVMHPVSTAPGMNLITDAGNVDGTIIWRRPGADMPLLVGAGYKFIFRYTDASNYEYLFTDEYGSGIIYNVVAGVTTDPYAHFSMGTSWSEVKVTLSGSTVDVYNGGASIATRTLTANLTGTGKGVELTHPACGISEFGVI